MGQTKAMQAEVNLEELGQISAVGGLWFDTAIARLRFVGTCCQQVAGCCQRVSVSNPLEISQLVERLKIGK